MTRDPSSKVVIIMLSFKNSDVMVMHVHVHPGRQVMQLSAEKCRVYNALFFLIGHSNFY